jgi:hypothetical protein
MEDSSATRWSALSEGQGRINKFDFEKNVASIDRSGSTSRRGRATWRTTWQTAERLLGSMPDSEIYEICMREHNRSTDRPEITHIQLTETLIYARL